MNDESFMPQPVINLGIYTRQFDKRSEDKHSQHVTKENFLRMNSNNGKEWEFYKLHDQHEVATNKKLLPAVL